LHHDSGGAVLLIPPLCHIYIEPLLWNATSGWKVGHFND